ncbi:FAD-dependent oxidoreductase [Paracrocinitomix mangrovi]|uniref:FAD-dependent oxidoreductase n=1 Tax=Paracrocinitomix mangrovi TaxID=2862509 RepID=UPI001C8EB178|nr:FAD-dependent oxidoreductase [Paracrocinitomix mangrovi]UKN03642.1 FAD-dependent oxidoreductase [Paracrocinitomix mangrovi]
MEKKKIAVIGAGPAGITAAYELSKKGHEVEVFEASPDVGGLSKTIDLWNQKVDLGPHRFFSNDTKVNQVWLEVVGKDYRMVDRLTRIYYKKKFYYYPLKPFDALKKLGLGTAFVCVMSYMKERIAPVKKDGSFETWVIGRFGYRLFSIFFKTYSEKLWGISCKDLDEDFAAQRIKKLSLFKAVWSAMFKGKKTKHKTLVDQFAYPLGGTGMVYERMRDNIVNKGNQVHLKSPVKRVICKNGKVNAVELVDGTVKDYDHVISSMPITHLVNNMDEVPEKVIEANNKLTFRNTLLVYLKVEGQDVFPDNWLYVHSSDLQMGRITNFRNWVPEINNNEDSTIVVLEYWAYDNDEIWNATDEDLIALGKDELRKTGLIKDLEISDGHVVKIPKCYPVYERGYKEPLKLVEDHLTSIDNLSVIGRYGAFKYNNQDHSILMGLLAAENIADGASNNLWEINTDYEDYQEKSTITESGLSHE